ncbi:SU10 major capsid protein [Mycobacterium sp. NPDC004974]
MATVSGQGTTFNLPNYTGLLFNVAPQDTPLLTAIGGLAGGVPCTAREFEWQTEGLESSSANNAKVEGAPAPTASEVSRSNVSNVCEIHYESVEISYTKLAAVGQLDGINTADGFNPVQDELSHQLSLKLKKMAIDVEMSFQAGTYAKPATNATARTTRGMLNVPTTNVFANGGTARALSKAIIDQALSDMYLNGSPLHEGTTVLWVHPKTKIKLTDLYTTATLNQPTMTRNIGGVAVDTLVTDSGVFGIKASRYMPQGKILISDLSVLRPRFLRLDDGSMMKIEELGRTGASKKWDIYFEIGLEYGPEVYHGLIGDLS